MNFKKFFKSLKRDNVFNEITYDDFEDIIREKKTSLFVIGGAWCDEFQAVISLADKVAKEAGIAKIDVYDPRFVNVFNEIEDLRDCLTLEHKLKYYYIVEHTGFKNTELVQDTLIAKMEVPTFFAIKDGVCLDYFTALYVTDNGGKTIHLKDDSTDKTNEFIERFKTLAKSLA